MTKEDPHKGCPVCALEKGDDGIYFFDDPSFTIERHDESLIPLLTFAKHVAENFWPSHPHTTPDPHCTVCRAIALVKKVDGPNDEEGS